MKKDLFLVIDMQNVYGDGGQWCCGNTGLAEKNILRILNEKEDLDVIFTQFIASDAPVGIWKKYNKENQAVNEDAYSNEIVASLKKASMRYPVYTKSTYSSLTIPEVLEAAKHADRVVVSGVVAECCVLATTFALIDEGCKVVYLKDACAGIDETTENAVVKVLEGLSPLHVEFMTTTQYLND